MQPLPHFPMLRLGHHSFRGPRRPIATVAWLRVLLGHPPGAAHRVGSGRARSRAPAPRVEGAYFTAVVPTSTPSITARLRDRSLAAPPN